MVGRNSYVMNVIIKYTSSGTHETCTMDDFACHAMAQSDRLGLEAIKLLHKQLDDDQDGNIDLSESDDVCTYYL